MEETIKGYKAFGKGMICRGKQYAENTTFEEESAKICESGMHFCESPLDCLDYYPLIDDNCNWSEYAEVEAENAHTDDGIKYVTTKLKIGKKLSLSEFIMAAVDMGKARSSNNAASGYGSKLAASGYGSNLAASGDCSKLAASGGGSKLAASGDCSQLAASGDCSKLAASGDYSKLAASGYGSKLAASGDGSQLAASGDYSNLAASGYGSQLAASGYGSNLAASGDYSNLAASGDYSNLAASGYGSNLAAEGKNCVLMCAGAEGWVKASLGSWITLAEWGLDSGEYIPKCVKTARVDGITIKADTYYTLKNGEFVEV